ncbi:MAG TPA: hypothetical protein VJY62_07045 [Bacteroidia bacterium]|nr:hypothetical protein [Bacteroidia bacterium]
MYKNDQELSTRAIAKGLLVGLLKDENNEVFIDDFLLWPPDLFALTSKILSLSGAYTNVIAPPANKPWPPKNIPYFNDLDWPRMMQYLGQGWRKGLEEIPNKYENFETFFHHFHGIVDIKIKKKQTQDIIDAKIIPPQIVQFFWERFCKLLEPESKGTINDFSCIFKNECPNASIDCHERKVDRCENCDLWDSFEAIMSLHAIADEACAGWGIRGPKSMQLTYFPENGKGEAQLYAESILKKNGTLSTINVARGRVLPKRHTPNVGITLRSLSANLAFHTSSVKINWRLNFDQSNKLIDKFSDNNLDSKTTKIYSTNNHSLSVLLFPWPFEINSKDFNIKPNPNINIENKRIEFFSYSPSINDSNYNSKLSTELITAIDIALNETSHIDMVILPECSLGHDEIKTLEGTLKLKGIPSYITGERIENNNSHFLENLVRFNMVDANELYKDVNMVRQNKHHRWKLTKSQILKYNLGHVLSPNKNWWEAINVKERTVNFINLGEELTVCPLICEDLARQDPIADLIRTIGPSLVVTILMDGPQKLERWSAKYASVLSEDPGCAVIAMTSLGMVKRYENHRGQSSNSIALISDGEGKIMEIELQAGAKGVLVNLCLSPIKESLADGRVDNGYTNDLIVGSVHQLIPKN